RRRVRGPWYATARRRYEGDRWAGPIRCRWVQQACTYGSLRAPRAVRRTWPVPGEFPRNRQMAGKDTKPDFATRCIHAGDTVDPATGAVMPAIHTSTTFEWEAPGQPREHIYTRASNPTRNALERCVAELEGGTQAVAYASGQAATAGVLDLLDAGAHVIAPLDFYGGTRRLFHEVRRRTARLEFSFVDMCDLDAVAAAVRPETRLIWIETPTNPLLRII